MKQQHPQVVERISFQILDKLAEYSIHDSNVDEIKRCKMDGGDWGWCFYRAGILQFVVYTTPHKVEYLQIESIQPEQWPEVAVYRHRSSGHRVHVKKLDRENGFVVFDCLNRLYAGHDSYDEPVSVTSTLYRRSILVWNNTFKLEQE